MQRPLFAGLAYLFLTVMFTASAWGQLEPPSTGGLVALEHELRMLGHYKRVLMIGAHPDDEDTELLTLLVRGWGAEAAYLSLNRGEGGQNLIGPELGPELGLIRTEELLAARRLDGAQQFFSRVYDFGYSKTLDETWQRWPRDTVLKDVVRVVRRFRPQIIVSIFSGTSKDGHGQHQAAGWAAHEAFRAAGDSTRFRELLVEEGLRPWVPQKLYRSTRFDSAATTMVLQAGVIDPAVGKSYAQIAMAGRSLHRSQDMGRLQAIGPAAVRVALVEGADSTSFFGGIDTTLAAMPWTEASGAASRELFAARVDSARQLVGNATMDSLAALLRRAEADLLVPKKDSIARVVLMTTEQAAQLRHLSRARATASRLVMDAVADDPRIAPGQRLGVTVYAWNAGPDSQAILPAVVPPREWKLLEDTTVGPMPIPSDSVRRLIATLAVPAGALPTSPYFLRRPLRGAMYDWNGVNSVLLGLPFDPAEPYALFQGPAFGARLEREVVFRANDQGSGEVRRPLVIVPRIDVKLDPAVEVWSTSDTSPRRFTVHLIHGARDTTAGTVQLELPDGWPPIEARRFRFTREDERRTFVFEVRPPAEQAADSVEIRAVAQDARGRRYNNGVFMVDYPHIRPRSYTKPAVATVRIAPLALPKLTRVGYVRGASDRVPEALVAVGVPITVLDAETLRRGELSRFEAIVVGPRAYETDSALVANNGRLLDYVRRGGLVIVQYQQHEFFRGGFAPYPLEVGSESVCHDRVADERAPVQVVAPDHAVVQSPNPLDESDWRGWVQERGLYFARSWDEAYQPIVETHDPGEEPLQGGLLVATVGRGTYVYTGLSFFRQLPAGVPGAFRLFANLLALRGRRR